MARYLYPNFVFFKLIAEYIRLDLGLSLLCISFIDLDRSSINKIALSLHIIDDKLVIGMIELIIPSILQNNNGY